MPTGFGPFAFDRQSRLLWRDGTAVALPPRVLGVLEVLIDRPGQVVARQDLLDGVWKDAFVTDTSLAEAISFLRQSLGDDPQAPRYIQTVHRRGYRFLPPLTETAPGGLTPADPVRGLTPEGRFAGASGARALSATLPPSMAWELLPWTVATVCAALAMAAVWRLAGVPPPEAPLIARFEVAPAEGTSFDPNGSSLAVSPDGRVLAWSACANADGGCALYTRAVDRLEATRLAGTDGGSAPFFSPDGRWVGFFADGKLKKIAASGGSPSTLADASAPGGGSWAPDGRIAFAATSAGGLLVISDQGGTVTTVTTPQADRGEVRHLAPAWVAGGSGLLFTIASSFAAEQPGQLAVLPNGTTTPRILRSGVTRAASVGPGYLLLSSGNDLQATAFDDRRFALVGSADSVLNTVSNGTGVAQAAVSPAGTLAAIPSRPPGRSRWTDRIGDDSTRIATLTSLVVSPDSTRAAGVVADSQGSDIWIADLASGVLTRVTHGGTHASPAWSADGQRIFFATRTTGTFAIGSRSVADRTAAVPVARPGAHLFPSSLASDGRMAVTMTVSGGRMAAAIVPAGGGVPQLLDDGPFDEAMPAFSPDGHRLAFESNESGRTEIVVRNLDDGRQVAVSSSGGSHPRWSADGRAVYFAAGRRLMRVEILPEVRRPDILFDRAGARVLAVTPTGRLLVEEQPAGTERALVVLQWLRELRQRLPLPVTAPR